MSYASLGDTGLTEERAADLRKALTLPQRQAMLGAAIAALPKCYGREIDDCVSGRDSGSKCKAINDGYVADWAGMEKAIDALPYCSQSAVPLWLAGVAVVGTLVVGIVVARRS